MRYSALIVSMNRKHIVIAPTILLCITAKLMAARMKDFLFGSVLQRTEIN